MLTQLLIRVYELTTHIEHHSIHCIKTVMCDVRINTYERVAKILKKRGILAKMRSRAPEGLYIIQQDLTELTVRIFISMVGPCTVVCTRA